MEFDSPVKKVTMDTFKVTGCNTILFFHTYIPIFQIYKFLSAVVIIDNT